MNKMSITGSIPNQFPFVRINQNKQNLIVDIISSLFILLFVYTAISKLYEIESFELTLKVIPVIGNYDIYKSLIWIIPIIELIIALCLFIPRFRLFGLWGSLVLMSAFTLFIGYLLLFKHGNLPCSCGGVIRQMSWKQHLVFNILFTFLAVVGILLVRLQKQKIDKQISQIVYT